MSSHLELQLDLLMAADGLPAVEREYRFHKTRRWRFDFAWPEYKVAVEVHGGTWSHGRHTRGLGFQKDRTKGNEAQLAGWLLLEVTRQHIESGKALVWIRRALAERGWNDGNA